MNLQDRLTALHKRMFTAEMPDILLDAYHMEMELRGFTIPEDDYKKGKAVLEHSLTDEQKSTRASVEASWEKNMKWSVGFGFLRGLSRVSKKRLCRTRQKMISKPLSLTNS